MFTYDLGGGAHLGRLEPWHAEQFQAAIDRYRDHLRPEVPVAGIVFTVEDARVALQRWADARADDTRHLFGIWRDGRLVGCVQLFGFDAELGVGELGVWIGTDAQGEGLVTRSCRVVIDWAFTERGLCRLQWVNPPGNLRSRAVARRLGMTWEALLRSARPIGGVRHDNEVWSVLADEWPTAPQ